MGNILNRFKRKDNIQSIEVKITKIEKGLFFILSKGKGVQETELPLKMSPIEMRHQQSLKLLELIDDLWYEEWIQQFEQGYLLPYKYVYQLLDEDRSLLNLPKTSVKLDLKLGHEGFVGTPRFRFVLEKNYHSWKHLERTGKQEGPFLTLADNTLLLMLEEQYEFNQLLNNSPDPMDQDKIFSYVAEVRTQAKKMGIQMDSYLERQDYLFVDSFDVDVTYDQEKIEINPTYYSSDNIEATLLTEMANSSSIYATDTANRKIFVNPETIRNVRKINGVGSIIGSDIPRFAENPESFIPEIDGFDLSLFSERVKELGIKVYRAQPYVHAQETKRGWFDINHGFSVVDDEGEKLQDVQSDEITKLVQEAKELGEDYIEWNKQWIRVPDDADVFVKATNKLKENMDLSCSVDISKLPYILEIYDNVNQLEFNQPILELQKEMGELGVFDKQPPTWFDATLKPFQVDGFLWMKVLHFRKIGGLLADDMGLGKTIQVIAFLAYLKEIAQLTPSLIIVPKTLIENWQNEMLRFAPDLMQSIYVHQGSSRLKEPNIIGNYSIVITTYQTLVKDQLVLGQVDWKATICDEAQAIKNTTTSVSRVIKALKSRFRIAMTGTPVENSLSELWSIMDYVQPGLLGSLKEFINEYIKPLEEESGESSSIEQKLINTLSVVYKRRTKQGELSGQLPQKRSLTYKVPLGEEQKKLYQEVLSLVQNKMMNGLKAIGELKKISSHPGLVNGSYVHFPPAKVPKLQKTLEIIHEIKDKGEKVLIFTEYHKVQEVLRRHIIEEFSIIPFIINGMTNRRQMVVDEFNRKQGFDVMILSPKAAGTGLTITSANHVIHYTRWWNPAVENQATDRVYRIGQEKDVTVHYPIVVDTENLLMSGTVEEIVHRIIEDKQELASSVIVPSKKLDLENEILSGMQLH